MDKVVHSPFHFGVNMSLTTTADRKILQTLKSFIPSAKVYLVGGAVRDYFMDIKSKDRDYVIVGATLHQIADAIQTIGKVSEVGKSFGIVKAVIDGEEYDFAIPRSEVSVGDGHKDFQITTDGVTLLEDLSRRDFTMNAIAYDIETGEFIDPHNGVNAIRNKWIVFVGTPCERYYEDPLRLIRMIQFAHRFEMSMISRIDLDKLNLGHLTSISKERIYEEYKKMFLKGKKLYKSPYIFTNYTTRDINKLLFGVNQFVAGDIEEKLVKDLSPDDVVNTYLITLFMYSGNYKNMCVTNDNIDHIEMARRIHRIHKGLETFSPRNFRNKELVYKVMSILKRFVLFPEWSSLAKKIFYTPTSIKEMCVTGDELLSMGIPNVKIGTLIDNMSVSMYTGELINDRHSVLQYINSSKEEL